MMRPSCAPESPFQFDLNLTLVLNLRQFRRTQKKPGAPRARRRNEKKRTQKNFATLELGNSNLIIVPTGCPVRTRKKQQMDKIIFCLNNLKKLYKNKGRKKEDSK